MKSTPLVAVTAAVLLASPALAQNLNRLQLDNGGDILWTLSEPFVGSDPVNGDFSGDLYWKSFPAAVLRRCTGAATLNGIEYVVADLDWNLDDATLWAFAITESTTDGIGHISPVLTTGADGVLLPEVPNVGLGNPDGPGGCAPAGYISGWVIQETFTDSNGNPTPLMQSTDPSQPDFFRANGTVHWTFTHFFPGGQSTVTPNPNSCGTVAAGWGGNATFSWSGSTDAVAGGIGENQPDFTGTGTSLYGGVQVGGGGGTFFETVDGGAELALLFHEPTLNMFVDADVDATGVELGLAGHNFPVGIQGGSCPGGIPAGTSPRLGTRLYSQSATPGGSLGFHAANVGATLLDLGIGCIPFAGGTLGLNPGDPIFTATLSASGIGPFQSIAAPSGASFGDIAWTSAQLGISSSCGLVGARLKWQAFQVTGSSVTGSSQVFVQNLRDNAGL